MREPSALRKLGAKAGLGRARDRVITSLGGHPGRTQREPAAPLKPPAARAVPSLYIGSTRFSLLLPGSADWRLTRQSGTTDIGNYARHLYSDERMSPRCDIFCELAVPIFQRMAERYDYRHLVQYSTVMPQRWTDRLRETAERYPVIQLVECDGEPPTHVELVRSTLLANWPQQPALIFAFRVDDDDLLSVDFLDQVNSYMNYEHVGWALSFSAGYTGLYEDGRYLGVAQRHQMLASVGQGAIGRWEADTGRVILTPIANHMKTDRKRTVILDGRQPVFFQTLHVGQDTATAEGEDVTPEVVRERMLTKLANRAGVVDPELLYKVFPTLRERTDLE